MSRGPVVDRLDAIRDAAVERGDWNLVAEIDLELARLGVDRQESAVADETFETVAAPRPRGRPRKIQR